MLVPRALHDRRDRDKQRPEAAFAEAGNCASDGGPRIDIEHLLPATFTPAQREFGPRLQAVIADNRELQEREAFKRADLAAAMTDALHKRDIPDPTARLAAELGVFAFYRAFARWSEPANQQTLTDLARQTLHELYAASAALNPSRTGASPRGADEPRNTAHNEPTRGVANGVDR